MEQSALTQPLAHLVELSSGSSSPVDSPSSVKLGGRHKVFPAIIYLNLPLVSCGSVFVTSMRMAFDLTVRCAPGQQLSFKNK